MPATPASPTTTAGDNCATHPARPATPDDSGATAVSPRRFDPAEITALLMTIVIGAGAFAWSFAALSDLSDMAGITPKLAWIGPVFVDGAIIQSTVALVSLQRRRKTGVTVPTTTTAFFWTQLLFAELVSIIGNGLHAAESGERILPATIAACVAGAAPVAGLAATHGLTALLEVPRHTEPTPTKPTEPVNTLPKTNADSSTTQGDAQATGSDSDATAGDSQATVPADTATAGDSAAPVDRDTRILALADAGHSTREIGAAVGLHHATVAKILARHRTNDTDSNADAGLRLITGSH
ncbi:DUF2637 domain-containing protein [Nocardia xishanensis]|uniref:DUF2637 domain-containing protein n=1 Tax=Nocardia xishanensis TaxID=238964 RepID=UPI0009FD7E10|nr:DUF2637 domain-containing protein [Nocardia xishanensis]